MGESDTSPETLIRRMEEDNRLNQYLLEEKLPKVKLNLNIIVILINFLWSGVRILIMPRLHMQV